MRKFYLLLVSLFVSLAGGSGTLPGPSSAGTFG